MLFLFSLQRRGAGLGVSLWVISLKALAFRGSGVRGVWVGGVTAKGLGFT